VSLCRREGEIRTACREADRTDVTSGLPGVTGYVRLYFGSCFGEKSASRLCLAGRKFGFFGSQRNAQTRLATALTKLGSVKMTKMAMPNTTVTPHLGEAQKDTDDDVGCASP
jgi:hypothetical protein